MAINKETHINASVVLDRIVYKKIKEIAKENKRSTSSQIAYMIDEYLKKEGAEAK